MFDGEISMTPRCYLCSVISVITYIRVYMICGYYVEDGDVWLRYTGGNFVDTNLRRWIFPYEIWI